MDTALIVIVAETFHIERKLPPDTITLPYGHAADVIGTQLYIFGGFNGKIWTNTLICYDTGVKSYNLSHVPFTIVALQEFNIPSTIGDDPSALGWHSMCSYGNKLIIFGGFDGDQWTANLYILDTSSMTWSETKTKGIYFII